MYSILTILHKPSSNSDCCWTQNTNVSLSYWCFLNDAGIQISMKSISLGERAVSCVNVRCVKPHFERFLSPRNMI